MADSHFFRILYENETLFHIPDARPKAARGQENVIDTPAPEPVKAVASEPVAQPKPITQPAPAAPPVTTEELPGFVSKHKILVLIEDPSQPGLIESEAVFLNNILKAVGHSLDEADVLNISFLQRNNIREVLSSKSVHYFITFGVPLVKLQLDLLLAPYLPKTIKGIQFLLADPLVVIEADRNLKKKLWQALQGIFEMP